MAVKERFKLIVDVSLVLVQNEQILLARRFQTGYADGLYNLPSGHLEDGEPAREAMVREVKEEIGIVIRPEDLEHVITTHRFYEDGERIGLFFMVRRWDGQPCNLEPNKCDDLRWFPLRSLPENIVPFVRQGINCYLNNKSYDEFGWK